MATSVQVQYRRGTAAQVASFVGAQGELVVDTTNQRVVVQDGATAGGWPMALATRTAVADAAYSALVTDRIIAYTSLTAARVITLPASASFPVGERLTVVDESGNCSLSKTLTITRAGSDTIDGATTKVLSWPNGAIELESNGVNGWLVVGKYTETSVVNVTSVADTAFSAIQTSRYIAYTSLTAPRIVSLPAAAAYNSNVLLFILDQSGSCSVTNTITAAAAGSDAINGAASVVLGAPYSYLALQSDGVSKWTIVARTSASFRFYGATSGSTLLQATGVASGTLSLPAATDTLVGRATTDNLSNKTFTNLTTVNSNAAALPAGPTGTVLQVGAADTVSTRAVIDAFAGSPALTFRRADTSAASPSAVQIGEGVGNVSGFGYGATGYSSTGRGIVKFTATQNWSDTVQGTNVIIEATPNGSLTAQNEATFQSGVGLGAMSPLGLGSLNATALYLNGVASLPQILGQSRIPFVLPSSGSMGNNGALSGITAAAAIYPNAYVYMPANAIFTGSAAGWYYAVFSSTTAATLYNNTYTSGTPAIPGSPTAFVTTGPGAYTQTSGAFIPAYQLAIAGNLIGLNGSLRTLKLGSYNNSANNKWFSDIFGGTTFSQFSGSTTTQVGIIGGVSNRGATNVQVSYAEAGVGITSAAAALRTGTVDTTTAQTYSASVQLSTATDTLTLEGVLVELLPGVP